MADRRVKLADVARLARVSPTTVSRVLSNDPRISVRTRQVVFQAAERLGYVRDARARSLRTQTTQTFGLLIPDVADPIHGQIAMAIEQEASAHGYTVLLANGFNDPAFERQALQLFTAQRTDGIVLVGTVLSRQEALSSAKSSHAVFITAENMSLAGYTADPPAGAIRADDAAGIEAVVQHLVDYGYRRVAYVSGPDLASNITRRDAALRALAAAGLGGAMYQYAGGVETWGAANAAAAAVTAERPEALICYDDVVALGMMDALRTHGLVVPDDIAIVGFDDIPFAAISKPRLTTVAQPSDEMGRRAVGMLLTALSEGALPPSTVLPVRLIVRESTVYRQHQDI